MGRMYFYYGTVNAGKTAYALMKRYEFELKGKSVVMIRPALNKNNTESVIRSRIGLEYKCIKIYPNDKLYDLIPITPDVIIVDEVQFMSKENIIELKKLNCMVFAFGLKTDYNGELFKGSNAMLCVADTIREIQTMCTFCKNKAIISAKHNDTYTPVCYDCWESYK